MAEAVRAIPTSPPIEVERDGRVTVLADPDRLSQVLLNLLDNAARHTPSDGIVRLSVRHEAGSGAVEVLNTGRPIPPEDLPRIFDRFYRPAGSPSDDGHAGLGLAIARSIISKRRVAPSPPRATSRGRASRSACRSFRTLNLQRPFRCRSTSLQGAWLGSDIRGNRPRFQMEQFEPLGVPAHDPWTTWGDADRRCRRTAAGGHGDRREPGAVGRPLGVEFCPARLAPVRSSQPRRRPHEQTAEPGDSDAPAGKGPKQADAPGASPSADALAHAIDRLKAAGIAAPLRSSLRSPRRSGWAEQCAPSLSQRPAARQRPRSSRCSPAVWAGERSLAS